MDESPQFGFHKRYKNAAPRPNNENMRSVLAAVKRQKRSSPDKLFSQKDLDTALQQPSTKQQVQLALYDKQMRAVLEQRNNDMGQCEGEIKRLKEENRRLARGFDAMLHREKVRSC